MRYKWELFKTEMDYSRKSKKSLGSELAVLLCPETKEGRVRGTLSNPGWPKESWKRRATNAAHPPPNTHSQKDSLKIWEPFLTPTLKGRRLQCATGSEAVRLACPCPTPT